MVRNRIEEMLNFKKYVISTVKQKLWLRSVLTKWRGCLLAVHGARWSTKVYNMESGGKSRKVLVNDANHSGTIPGKDSNGNLYMNQKLKRKLFSGLKKHSWTGSTSQLTNVSQSKSRYNIHK